jgi:hypothetical protein
MWVNVYPVLPCRQTEPLGATFGPSQACHSPQGLCRPGQGLSSIDSGWGMGLVVWYQTGAADRQWLHLALCQCSMPVSMLL